MRSSCIVGIDPGLSKAGWSAIQRGNGSGSALELLALGVIDTTSSRPLDYRLFELYTGFSKVFSTFSPCSVAVESTFINCNNKSSIMLAQARGAIILSVAIHKLKLREYAANLIKSVVTGNGHADKEQVKYIIAAQLNNPSIISENHNATDATAVALCHIIHEDNPILNKT